MAIPKQEGDILIDDIAAVYGVEEVLDALADWCDEEKAQAACKSKGDMEWGLKARVLRHAAERIRRL